MRALLIGSILLATAGVAEARRLALVVGNGTYTNIPALRNPGNDARAIAGKLRALDFDVTVQTDLSGRRLREAMDGFAARIRADDVAVVYYAGHGLEIDGSNYLLGVDFDPTTPTTAVRGSFQLAHLMQRLDRTRARLKLAIFDACRNYPVGWDRDLGSRGFVLNDGDPRGSLFFFASKAGKVASDGPGQPHSPFAQAILDNLDTAGLELYGFVGRVTDQVQKATQNAQVPHISGSVARYQFFFKGGPAPPPRPRVPQPPDMVRVVVNVGPVPADIRLGGQAEKVSFNHADVQIPRSRKVIDVEVTPRGKWASRYRPFTARKTLEGEMVEVNVELQPESRLREMEAVPLVLLTSSAVLAGVGIATHVLAFKARSDGQALLDSGDASSKAVQDKEDERAGFMTAAGVSYAAAAVTLGLGLYWLLDEDDGVAIVPTASGLAIGGRF